MQGGGVLVRRLVDATGERFFACAAAFSADTHLLAAAGDNKVVQVWDTETGAERGTLNDQPTSILALATARDRSEASCALSRNPSSA